MAQLCLSSKRFKHKQQREVCVCTWTHTHKHTEYRDEENPAYTVQILGTRSAHSSVG